MGSHLTRREPGVAHTGADGEHTKMLSGSNRGTAVTRVSEGQRMGSGLQKGNLSHPPRKNLAVRLSGDHSQPCLLKAPDHLTLKMMSLTLSSVRRVCEIQT